MALLDRACKDYLSEATSPKSYVAMSQQHGHVDVMHQRSICAMTGLSLLAGVHGGSTRCLGQQIACAESFSRGSFLKPDVTLDPPERQS